jgi:hypothetical protein
MVLARPPEPTPTASRAETSVSGAKRDAWIKRNWYYHREIQRICGHYVPAQSRTLVVGSQTGDILSAMDVNPAKSVAIDSSEALVEYSRAKYPNYRFEHGQPDELAAVLGDEAPFDYIVLPDLVGMVEDLQRAFAGLHPYCHAGTRLVLTSYNFLWEPVLGLGEKLGMKIPQPDQNWLSMDDVSSILRLSEFRVDEADAALLIPRRVPLGDAINAFAARNRLLRHLCLIQYHVATYQPPTAAQLARREALNPPWNAFQRWAVEQRSSSSTANPPTEQSRKSRR